MGLKPRSGKSADLKTKPTQASPQSFIASVENEQRRREAQVVLELMNDVTGLAPAMWGASIIGYGTYHYKYASGREGDWPRTGFSPRKASLTVYCMPGFKEQSDLLEKLGPHKTSVSCIYIRNLDKVDLDVLRAIVARSLVQMDEIYGK